MFSARSEITIVPGATTSGLNRPKSPSTPMPTLPRLEKAATWLLLSVLPRNGVAMFVLPSALITTATLVRLRGCSTAPDGDHVLAVAGDKMLSESPLMPVSSPLPAVARREHEQQRLGAGHQRQRVAHRRVIAGRGDVVAGVVAVVPTIVRDQRIGQGRPFLQITVGVLIDRHHKTQGVVSHPPEIRVADRALGVGHGGGLQSAAQNGPGHMRAMADGVRQDDWSYRLSFARPGPDGSRPRPCR